MMRALIPLLAAVLLAVACGPEPPAPRSDAPSEQAATENLHTCGMHPQVLHEGPGSCPICGMDLTPVAAGGAPASKPGERKIKYWVAPMDPTYISETPGKSPMGMDLVPVYEDEAPGTAEAGVVAIDPVVAQNMGVRVEPVRRQTVFRHVRSIGEVEVGEDQISAVNVRFSGWVERIHVDKTGDPVDEGQTLFEIYSPELVAAQEEYLLAIRRQGPRSELARSARRKFELWDIDPRDVSAIASSGKALRTLPIRSPRAGFVLHKNVMEGARVMAGQDLYRVGDLRQIWVTAEIYEFDAPWVEVGQPAQMSLSYEEGRILEGKVAYIYPTLNEVSRTLTVRLEFENPDIRLKPGMFATVYIQYRRKDEVLAIPTEAIIDSGRRKIVFVAQGDGRFEAREVVTGLTGDRRITEVLSGLVEREEIVVSGQFLLDSESQLQEAIRKMLERRSGAGRAAAGAPPSAVFSCPMHPEVVAGEPGRCPECGMDLDERPGSREELARVHGEHAHAPPAEPEHSQAPTEHEHGESAGDAGGMSQPAKPGQYSCPMHPAIVSDDPGRCPVCGMFLEKVAETAEEGP